MITKKKKNCNNNNNKEWICALWIIWDITWNSAFSWYYFPNYRSHFKNRRYSVISYAPQRTSVFAFYTVTGAAWANCGWTTYTGWTNRRTGVSSSTGARPEWLFVAAHIAATVGATAEQTGTAAYGTEWPHEATAPLFSQVFKLFT